MTSRKRPVPAAQRSFICEVVEAAIAGEPDDLAVLAADVDDRLAGGLDEAGAPRAGAYLGDGGAAEARRASRWRP